MDSVHRRPEKPTDSDLLTTGQAAEALGVRSVNTVKQWVRNGTLVGFRRGSRILVLRESVLRLQNDARSQGGGTIRGLTRAGARRSENADVLSALRGLPESADAAERAAVLARTMAEIKSRVEPLLRSRAISRAFLFGSVARGNVHSRSDIDIIVEVPRDSTMDLVDFIELGLELEAALGRKVDLVNLATMKPGIRERAEREQVSLL